MPAVVFVLAAAVFAQGTSEFMLSGLLADIAADSGVTVGTAGLLTSLFAAGMVLGAPSMAMAVGAIPRRTAMIGFLVLFCLSHVLGALSTEFAVLLGSRLLAAFANAGFLAVTLASLPALVAPAVLGRATSVILSGITLACIAGVPAGTALGQLFGWPAAFWAIALLTAVALAVLVPMTAGTALDGERANGTTPIRREWRVIGARGLWRVIVLGALVNAATFAAFTYLGTITGVLTSPGSAWVPLALALFGAGSFAGVTIAGRYSDRYRAELIGYGCPLLVLVWLCAVFGMRTLPGLLVFAVLSAALAFGVGATLITAIVQTATPAAPRLAGALATTAFNAGAVLGPAVAGAVVGSAAQAGTALWVSVGCAGVAALLTVRRRASAAASG